MKPLHGWRNALLMGAILSLSGCYSGVRLHYRSEPAGADFYTGHDDADGQLYGPLVGQISSDEWSRGVHCLTFPAVTAEWLSGTKLQVAPQKVCLDQFNGAMSDRYVVVVRPEGAPDLQLDMDYAHDYLATHEDEASPDGAQGTLDAEQDAMPAWGGGAVYVRTGDEGYDGYDGDRHDRRHHHEDGEDDGYREHRSSRGDGDGGGEHDRHREHHDSDSGRHGHDHGGGAVDFSGDRLPWHAPERRAEWRPEPPREAREPARVDRLSAPAHARPSGAGVQASEERAAPSHQSSPRKREPLERDRDQKRHH